MLCPSLSQPLHVGAPPQHGQLIIDGIAGGVGITGACFAYTIPDSDKSKSAVTKSTMKYFGLKCFILYPPRVFGRSDFPGGVYQINRLHVIIYIDN